MPFQILKVLGENSYLLDFPDDLKISPIFTVADLYPYVWPNAALSLSVEIEGDFVDGREELMRPNPKPELEEEDDDSDKSQI